MSALAVHALTKHFGKKPALDRASLEVAEGERCVVLGASGAGKTTFLRLIAGLERPDSGTVSIAGRAITNDPPQKRATSLVFSDGGLFPHLTVFENLAFTLRMRRVRRADVRAQVLEIAQRLHITPYISTRAALLSGGERQRVALGRALLHQPRVLLLDEPVAHLDPSLRDAVRASILESVRARGCAVVYVTHDHEDAFIVGDRVAILIAGRLVQCATPQAVYNFPASVEVAGLVGPVPMNLFDGGTEIVGIRAEHIELVNEGSDLSGIVCDCSFSGASWLVAIDTPQGMARVRVSDSPPLRGTRVGLRFAPSQIRRFDRRTGLAV